MWLRSIAPWLAAASLAALAPLPAAGALKAGDILVADSREGLLQIDGTTRAVQLFVPIKGLGGTQLAGPIGVAIGPSGAIHVLDQGDGATPPAIWTIDPASGQGTVLTSGGLLEAPLTMVVGLDGTIYVADIQASGGNGAVLKITSGGAQSVFLAGGHPAGLAVDQSGNLSVSGIAQYRVQTYGPSGVLGWDTPTPGFYATTMAVGAGNQIYMFGLDADSNWDGWLLDATSRALVHFYGPTGPNGSFNGAAVLPNGDIAITAVGLFPVVAALHPDGSPAWNIGDYFSNPFFNPVGIAVYGVRNGVVPAANATWGQVKDRYRH